MGAMLLSEVPLSYPVRVKRPFYARGKSVSEKTSCLKPMNISPRSKSMRRHITLCENM